MNCTKTEEGPGTILIVDDEADDLRFTQRIVASVCPGFVIKGVVSGAELMRYLQGDGVFSDRNKFPYPSLILLDLRMPGIHGFETLRWLRKSPPHDLVPVAVLTGSGEMTVAQSAYALGAWSFLTKPLKADEFKHTMVKFEDGRRLSKTL